jgi:hypothetical protein
MIFHGRRTQGEFPKMKSRSGMLKKFALEKRIPETHAGVTGLQS